MVLGPAPTGIVATTEFVAVSITETVFEPLFATYMRVPDGLSAGA
ncbi:unannotated protein [freshwater metagenome]|uniref:Unannotated protein n=1 Tax=freshwater metagenome TaxID=449393 RepID=A0A6J7MXK1_9ZZZZ